MTDRLVSDAALAPSSRLVGQPLASPVRRITGFMIDCALLVLPSLLVAVGSSAISLYITDRVAFQAIKTELVNRPQDHAELVTTLGRMAPLSGTHRSGGAAAVCDGGGARRRS